MFTFGPEFYGALPGRGVHKVVVHLRSTASGNGYYMLTTVGGVYGFGDAIYRGAAATTGAVDITVV